MTDANGSFGSMETETETPPAPSVRPQILRTIIVAILFTATLGAYIVSHSITFPQPLPEVFLALTAAMAVHLLDRLWLFRDTVDSLNQLRKQIVDNVARDTRAVFRQTLTSVQKSIESLEAMRHAGLVRVYANREQASNDIYEDMTSRQNRKIRLIGVSLNDFVLRKNPRLGNAWHTLEEWVEKGISEHRTLDVRILMVDPTCFGAQLRAVGEGRRGAPGRLFYEAELTIKALLRLQRTCKQDRVKFECRLYRLPPVMFLCLTDSWCYSQQYYFWSSHSDNISFPILRFQNVSAPSSITSIHSDLEQHFDWIWNRASVGIAEYEEQFSPGADKGIAEVGIVNVFTDADEALKRINYLLANAKQRVCIQGISLHSYFLRNKPLYKAIGELISREIDVELLFLDPQCEQAVIRAYREWSFDNPGVPLDQYLSSGLHEQSLLFSETTAAIRTLEATVRDIAARKPAGWTPKLRAGFYKSAPHCFLLRVDDSVLIEQYHYGKLPADIHGARAILGKDLPLVEYAKEAVGLFEPSKTLPFALLESHFDFALGEAKMFPVEQWAHRSN